MYSFCCVIPVIKNTESVPDMIRRAKLQMSTVLVIDGTLEGMDLRLLPPETEVIHQTAGRAAMLRTAFALLQERQIDYMVLLDPTEHYFPEDLSVFSVCLQKNDRTLAIGCRDFLEEQDSDGLSLPCRNWSNRFFRLETGIKISDAASTFRAYPVKYVCRLLPHLGKSDRIELEAELLVRAAWSNLEIRTLRVRCNPRVPRIPDPAVAKAVGYRLAYTHLKLLLLCLLPYRKQEDFRPEQEKLHFSLFRPKEFFSYLLRENASARSLAGAAFLGTYCAVLPLFGFHTPVVLYLATIFRLNRFLAFMIQHPFAMSPLTPFLCIELGYFMRNGEWLTEFTWQTLGRGIFYRIWEWLLGSLALAPLFAVLSAVTVYICAFYVQKKIRLKFRADYRRQITDGQTEDPDGNAK